MLAIMLEEDKEDRLQPVPLLQMRNQVVMAEMQEEIVREIGDYFKQMQKVTIVEEEVVQQLREILLMKI
jgi:DNA-binding protein H-NS